MKLLTYLIILINLFPLIFSKIYEISEYMEIIKKVKISEEKQKNIINKLKKSF